VGKKKETRKEWIERIAREAEDRPIGRELAAGKAEREYRRKKAEEAA
jgi:hypothetical protein